MGWNWEEPSKDGWKDERGDERDSEEEEEEEEKESVREGLDARGYEGAVCDSNEGLVGLTCGGEPSRGSIWKGGLFTGAPEGRAGGRRSGEVSFNLDIALPRLVPGDETEEPWRSKESE
jgi:hypothetical protein